MTKLQVCLRFPSLLSSDIWLFIATFLIVRLTGVEPAHMASEVWCAVLLMLQYIAVYTFVETRVIT